MKRDRIGRQTCRGASPPHLFGLSLAERYFHPRFAGEGGLSDERTVAFQVVANALGNIWGVFDGENERLHIRLLIAGRKSTSPHEDAKRTD